MILGYEKAPLGSLSPLYFSGAKVSLFCRTLRSGEEKAEPLSVASSLRIRLSDRTIFCIVILSYQSPDGEGAAGVPKRPPRQKPDFIPQHPAWRGIGFHANNV